MTTTEQNYATSPLLAETLKKYQQIAAFVGLPFLALLVAGYFIAGPQQFLRSYLIGMFFWFGMGMGCLALLMVHFVAGGAWGMMIRRPLEAGARTIPVMWLMFLPLLILAPKLYAWADPAHAGDKIVLAKHLYLNLKFLWIRWLIYGLVWVGLSMLLNRWSLEEDRTKSWKISNKLESLSAPGLAAYFFTITFASIDFLMSLDVTWASTIYGFLIAVGQGLSAMSLVVAVLVLLGKFEPMDHAITAKHLHDLGKLMLALVMLWAYLSFSQYLIIYSANLPQEITWYVRRLNGGWQWVGLFLLLLHFALPFALLLSQALKKNPKTISSIAIFIICIRVVDVFWLVEPNFVDVNHPVFTVSWLDFVAPIGFGGLWLAMFFNTLPTRPLLPLGAPDLQKALNHGREH
ncbi:MAG: hypothetical protein M3N93_12920 [Acidobacteriota bacterium]|nr:hypothetical protein [Acidobacteriota bacterium]